MSRNARIVQSRPNIETNSQPYYEMKKIKIFSYHLVVFILGSVGIIAYVFYRLTSPTSGAGLGGVIVMPAVVLIYVIVFGILCAISLLVWLLINYLRNK